MRTYQKMVVVLAAIMLLFVLVFPAAPAMAQDEVSVLFINVGKADAALLFLGEQRFLVDTGTKDSYDELERALKLYQVERLDGVLITHPHKDHAGGLKKLLKSGMPVTTIYAGKLHNEESDQDHPAAKAAEKYEVALKWLSAGDEIDFGNGCKAVVLGPISKDPLMENNNSLVLDIQTPEGNLLLTGDMEFDEEADLLQNGKIPNATVLKVAHHGEDDSTSAAFVQAVMPQWAVISTNTAEEPDTPDQTVLANLWHAKAGVAVTQDAQIGILVKLADGAASAESINMP
ncbi:MAG: MBL fold metallo-hydrolase [Clostridia bacterium]